MSILMFYPLSALVILLSCGVLFVPNPVHAAMLLIGAMCGIAGLFLCLNCELLAMFQILIYVGAIMVLFLFIVMTVDTKKEEHFTAVAQVARVWGLFLCAAMGILFLFVVLHFTAHLPDSTKWLGDARSMGNAFLRTYSLPFEVITLLLLTAMAGVVVMTRKPLYRHADPPQPKEATGGNQA